MKKLNAVLALIAVPAFALAATACQSVSSAKSGAPCSSQWIAAVEATLISADGQGHGPDPGSSEWQSVIEFKLGVRDQPDVPARTSKAWCNYIDRQLGEQQADKAAASP